MISELIQKTFSDVIKYVINKVAIIADPIINEQTILLAFLVLQSIAQNSSLLKNLRNFFPLIKDNK